MFFFFFFRFAIAFYLYSFEFEIVCMSCDLILGLAINICVFFWHLMTSSHIELHLLVWHQQNYFENWHLVCMRRHRQAGRQAGWLAYGGEAVCIVRLSFFFNKSKCASFCVPLFIIKCKKKVKRKQHCMHFAVIKKG